MQEFVARLDRHLRWQRKQQLLAGDAARQHRFLILRPGDRYTVCNPLGFTRRAAHNKSLPGCLSLQTHMPPSFMADPRVKRNAYRGHWDAVASQMMPNFTRIDAVVGGLGNIMSALVSAAAVAMLSRRILLVENMTDWRRTFGSPLSDLVLEGSAFEASLLAAQDDEQDSRLDSFMAQDDFSVAVDLCSTNLRHKPRQRAWRLMSNQYFLPLMLLNPHHSDELASMAGAPPDERGDPQPAFWGPALSYFFRPLPHVMRQVDHFRATHFMPGERVIGVHFRCLAIDGLCRYGTKKDPTRAVECARTRLLASGAKHLFVATMHHSHRLAFERGLSGVANVSWYGKAVEQQDQSVAQEEARMVDLMLLSRMDELLLATHSTFSHMARAMALGHGIPSTWYSKCSSVPPAATEPNLHLTSQLFRDVRKPQCSAGNRSLLARSPSAFALANTRGMLPIGGGGSLHLG